MSGMIFDVDGTLVDTNSAHVEAWHRAFKRLGFEVPVERIMVEIGKGEDKLVPSILGGDVEERCGDALRRAQKEDSAGLDLTLLAVHKLALTSSECAMVGDTVFDGQACASAGVVFLGVQSGGTPPEELFEVAAAGVWRDVGHLLADLDHALEIVSLAATAPEYPSTPTRPGAPYR